MKTNIKNILATKTKQALSSNILQADYIRKNIVILDELRSLIPPLSTEEFSQLEENILAHGCQTALQVWQAPKKLIGLPYTTEDELVYVLIDGHNRFSICSKHNLPFEIYQLFFDDLKAAKDYMITLQLGRRNLSPTQVAYLRGLRYNNEKSDKANNLPKGQNDPLAKIEENFDEKHPKGQNDPLGVSTADRLAKEYNVSSKTIKRDAEFAKGLEKLSADFRNEILAGNEKVDKGLIQKIGKLNIETDSIIDASFLNNLVEKTETFPILPTHQIIQQKSNELQTAVSKFSKTLQKKDLEKIIKIATEALQII